MAVADLSMTRRSPWTKSSFRFADKVPRLAGVSKTTASTCYDLLREQTWRNRVGLMGWLPGRLCWRWSGSDGEVSIDWSKSVHDGGDKWFCSVVVVCCVLGVCSVAAAYG